MSGRSMNSPHSAKSVAILLCTRNGDRFLPQQLDSLRAQTHSNWKVWASDDSSTDSTLGVLGAYAGRWERGQMSIRPGPGKGFVANFLSLACDVSIEADYFAFCDQDDVWDADKLERALTWLATVPAGTPALYCARSRLIDEAGGDVGFSPLFARPATFRNALVQSIAGGNTMVFNRAARKLLVAAGADVDVITHDWWLYMLVTGCGGTARYDFHASVRYRQHGRNLVGSNASWGARYSRARRLMAGNFSAMNQRNLTALKRVDHLLSPEAARVVRRFTVARAAWFLPRVAGVARSGVYHHTLLGTMGLIVAILFKKL